ncbi:hypothetical protein KR009_006694, partial [Drosophila setifemur]
SKTRKSADHALKQLDMATSGTKLRRCSTKDKDKKKERWLLTRKTWRYMTDAGRKLIPDGTHAGAENIPLFEEHFQRVCSSEPSFMLWHRKASYPGAVRNSKRCLKHISRHASFKHESYILKTVNEYDNADQIIKLLQTYLKICDVYKTTTLLGTNTVRPDQTSSPSAHRPVCINLNINENNKNSKLSDKALHSELLYRLQLLSDSSILVSEGIQLGLSEEPQNILEDKVILKKIYSALKKQQLHRSLHSTDPPKPNLSRATSLTSLFKTSDCNNKFNCTSLLNQYNNHHDVLYQNLTSQHCDNKIQNLHNGSDKLSDFYTIRRSFEFSQNCLKHEEKLERSLSTCGTQTSYIQLNELKRLAEQHKLTVEYNLKSLEKQDTRNSSSVSSLGSRKSSIDNEDISQSVSDTIKRYLKMARKKSVHESDASRFKSINYDKSLKNIFTKGEINLPGINDGLNKAVQTLDAWPLIELDFIRGYDGSQNLKIAHMEWQRAEDERLLKKLEWNKKEKHLNRFHTTDTISSTINGPYSACVSMCTSEPTSPTQSKLEKTLKASTGLLSSSSHFLSNIWHGHNNTGSNLNDLMEKSQNTTNFSKNATPNMKKSKSLSNVGQFVTKKIWRGRSKSNNSSKLQKDLSCTPTQKWYSSENGLWISEDGDKFELGETILINLTETETGFLKDVILEKIKEMNIGSIVDLDKESQKRRTVQKKKSMTTSLFDIGKRDDQREVFFGISLECCLTRDRKCTNEVDRSKCSLMSVFRGNVSHTGSDIKLNDTVRSCESLPSNALEYECTESFTNISKPSTSLTQFEIIPTETNFVKPYNGKTHLKVPAFVNNCIEYLEHHGLQKVGLFRVSTSKKRVKQLREEFNRDSQLSIPDDTCSHDVATLLKEFLRDLPEPLLCRRFYSGFIETQRIRNRRLQLEAISHLIRLLPIPHRDTLYVLLIFLAKVSAHSDDLLDSDGNCIMYGNKMDSNNLATVFAPNILRGTHLSTERHKEQEHMSDAINVVRTMIDHYEDMFKISADLLNIMYAQMQDACPETLYELISNKRNILEW